MDNNLSTKDVQRAQDSVALMDYNEAYYRWVFGPEKDEKANHERLLKMRHIYFSLWRYFLTFIKSIVE